MKDDKPKRGAPKKDDRAKISITRSVAMDDEHNAKAVRIGGGNRSRGVKLALDNFREVVR